MSTLLDFTGGDGNYRFAATLITESGPGTYTFDVRWNTRDNAWRFDMFDPQQILMVAGIKIVLNVPLGRRSSHPFFNHNSIIAVDYSDYNLDPDFDDIGKRVKIWHMTESDVMSLRIL